MIIKIKRLTTRDKTEENKYQKKAKRPNKSMARDSMGERTSAHKASRKKRKDGER